MPALLLLAGGGIVAVLAWSLWHQAEVERDLRAADAERAHTVAERIAQRAPANRAAFALVPAALRAAIDAHGAIDVADVGWLAPASSPVDDDLVVDDRIERATRSEFVDRDAAAAQRAYDELLAAPLVSSVRTRAVAAAAWQAVRANERTRADALRTELDERIATFTPRDLARPAVARAVAAALRLPTGAAGESAPAWAAQLAPFLPPDVFAGLPDVAPWSAAHAAIVQRRTQLAWIDGAWHARAVHAENALVVVDEHHVLWWQAREDGGFDAALLAPAAWCAAVARAGRDGALPELPLPWRWALAANTSEQFAGVPGIAGVTDADSPRAPLWVQPAVTGGLLLVLAAAFAFTVRAQLRAARAEVRAVRTQSEFLTTVTHELKTPLASIRLLGEMLADGRAVGREHDYYRMLAGEAGRLSLLIENVLDLGRLERGERAYDLRATDAGEVVSETLAMFAPVVERDSGTVAWHDASGGGAVRVDRGALVQALVAVLDNARKYGGAGGRIDVATRRDGERLAIDVRDHGPGVPMPERERIFARFVRGAAHAHGSTPGVGIGLHLARTIARAMRGDLVCIDPLDGGAGACFTFLLPVENPA